MNIDEIKEALEDAFDAGLLFHAFKDYTRDYEIIVEFTSAESTGIPPAYVRYVFVNCVQANTSTAFAPDQWPALLDERLIDVETGQGLGAYVWGVKWQDLYPGFRLVEHSPIARRWSRGVGIPFIEIQVRMSAQDLSLVFSDLRVEEVAPGYAPFAVHEPLLDIPGEPLQ